MKSLKQLADELQLLVLHMEQAGIDPSTIPVGAKDDFGRYTYPVIQRYPSKEYDEVFRIEGYRGGTANEY